MNPRLKAALAVTFGVMVWMGGWWFFLISIEILPMPPFSIPITIVLLFGILAMLGGMLGYGPLLVYEAIKNYEEETTPEEDEVWESN